MVSRPNCPRHRAGCAISSTPFARAHSPANASAPEHAPWMMHSSPSRSFMAASSVSMAAGSLHRQSPQTRSLMIQAISPLWTGASSTVLSRARSSSLRRRVNSRSSRCHASRFVSVSVANRLAGPSAACSATASSATPVDGCHPRSGIRPVRRSEALRAGPR